MHQTSSIYANRKYQWKGAKLLNLIFNMEKTDAIVTVHITVYQALSKPPELSYGNR